MKKKPINLKLLEGVIVPGETYLLLNEPHFRSNAGPIEDLFTIRSVEEMVTAIEELGLLIAVRFEFREILEVRSLDNGRYILRVWCHDKKRKKNGPIYLFLHRIPGAGEMLREAKERNSMTSGI